MHWNCHVKLQNHVIEESDIRVLLCHVILQNHVNKGSYDFMGRNPSR